MSTTTVPTTKTKMVNYSDLKVGDVLARLNPRGGGYCNPANSFLVTAVTTGVDGFVTVTTEHPETGELDVSTGYGATTMTSKVVGFEMRTVKVATR